MKLFPKVLGLAVLSAAFLWVSPEAFAKEKKKVVKRHQRAIAQAQNSAVQKELVRGELAPVQSAVVEVLQDGAPGGVSRLPVPAGSGQKQKLSHFRPNQEFGVFSLKKLQKELDFVSRDAMASRQKRNLHIMELRQCGIGQNGKRDPRAAVPGPACWADSEGRGGCTPAPDCSAKRINELLKSKKQLDAIIEKQLAEVDRRAGLYMACLKRRGTYRNYVPPVMPRNYTPASPAKTPEEGLAPSPIVQSGGDDQARLTLARPDKSDHCEIERSEVGGCLPRVGRARRGAHEETAIMETAVEVSVPQEGTASSAR